MSMGYSAGDIRFDCDSIANQRIKSKYVGDNVQACVSSMVEYILRHADGDENAPFTHDDVENLFVPICPDCGSDSGFEEASTSICEVCGQEIEDYADSCAVCGPNTETESVDGHKCIDCGLFVESVDNLDTEPQEVYEWWVVTSWLLDELRKRGEVVIPHENIWGRTCTGQAIKLDGIISAICSDMGILEGQRNEWKVA